MSLAKRILSSFVSLTTVLSTVGTGMLALPHSASAATLVAGDLIKASGPTVYYYASDSRRYVFPNETTFFSWFSDFSSVKVLSDSELAAIPLVRNLTIRPGTKLVKITTDPKVYTVSTGGVLHWIQSEALAAQLYGSSWNRRVVDVQDGYFQNYTTGSALSSAVHPDGTVISYANDSSRYVVLNGMKRKLTGSAFSANMYNEANVIQTTIVYPDGSDITGREAMIWDAIYNPAGTNPGPVTPVAGNLMVALASDTPARATLPQGSSGSQLAKFNFTAGSSAVRITGLSIHRRGVGATTDFNNLYLYDVNGMRLTTGRSINSVNQTVEFNGLNWTIPAGQTWSLVLVGDVKETLNSGGEHLFELMNAAAVITSTTGTTIAGTFPIVGNSFVIGTTSAARLDVQNGSTVSNPNVGSTGVEISNFKLTANTNDVLVKRVTLYQAGSIPSTDLKNFKLYQGSTLVAEGATISANNQIVLTFSGNGYTLPNGVTRVFSLKADVSGRSTNTIKTYVEYSSDVQAIDMVYGSGVLVCNGTSTASNCNGSFDGAGSNFQNLTVQGGQLTVAYNGPATTNVAKGQNNVVFMRFALTSQSSNLEIRNMRVTIGATAGGLITTGTTDYIRNVRVRDMANGQTIQGPTSASGASTPGAATSTFNFNNSVYLNAGQTRNFEIVADMYNTDNTDFIGKKYRASLNAFQTGDVRVVDTNEQVALTDIVPNSTISGNEMTVQAGSLVVTLASTPSSANVVKRQADIPTLGLNFTAGGQSDSLVTALSLVGSANIGSGYANAYFVNVITTCSLYDGLTLVGQSKIPDSAGVMSFTNMNWSVSRGTTKVLTVKCTADSVVNNTGSTDTFAVGVSSVTAQDQDSNTITATVSGATNNLSTSSVSNTPSSVIMTVQNGGTITINADSMPQSTLLVAGSTATPNETWQRLAQYRATAQYEDMVIDRVFVTSTGLGVMYDEVAVAVDGAVRGSDSFSGGTSQSKDILLLSPIVVPKNGNVVVQLLAKLNPITPSSSVSATTAQARSGQTVQLGIASNSSSTTEYDTNYANKFNIRVTGQASGERVYAATTTATVAGQGLFGNSFIVRATKPTVSRVALTSGSTVLAGSPELYRFNVQADALGSVALKKLTFRLAASTSSNSYSSLQLTNFRILKGSTTMNTLDYSIVNGQTGETLKSTGTLTAPSTTLVVVNFTNPEVVDAGGSTQYALKADVTGSVAGDLVTTSFLTQTSGTNFTGFLNSATSTIASMAISGSNLNSTSTESTISEHPGTFVWSDRSEVSGGTATSGDWTDDLYLQDLTDSQQLSRV